MSGASATIPGLTESTAYQVRVLARNAEGDSPWSLPGSGQTGAQRAPDVPHSLSATRGNRQVMLSWVQPSGGAEVTRYEYEQDVSGAWISTRSTDTDYTVRNLTNGQSYTFRVRAANSAGQSAPSAASSSVTPATAPGAPRNIGVTAGDEQVTLNWTAPASNGGETITGYEYEQNGSGDLGLHGRDGPERHGDGPDERPVLQVQGAGPQQRRGGRGLRRLVERHAREGAERADESERHGQRIKAWC